MLEITQQQPTIWDIWLLLILVTAAFGGIARRQIKQSWKADPHVNDDATDRLLHQSLLLGDDPLFVQADSSCGPRVLQHPIEVLAVSKPDAVALVIPGKDDERHESITFSALNAWADGVADKLRAEHVSQSAGTAVGVGAENYGIMAAILGIWKTGNPYVPLSPTLPAERVSFIIHDAAISVIIVDDASLDRFSEACCGHVPLMKLDAANNCGTPALSTATNICAEDNLCYILYTSGSTGKPKGVQATHRSMYNRFSWMWKAYPFIEGESGLAWTSTAFVDHVWEMFGTIGGGMPLVFALHLGLKGKPREALRIISKHEVSRIVLVPSLLRELLLSAESVDNTLKVFSSMRFVTVSGEALPSELVRRFVEVMPDGTRLLNIYGCTEVAADVTCAEFRRGLPLPGEPLAPIGRPISGVAAQLVDPMTLLPVARGTEGELLLSGECLAEGYLNRPEEQAERFVILKNGERAFRTGDFCREAADGSLSFVGRQDQQVKVNGQRVEVLEVEQALQGALSADDDGSRGVVVAVQGSNSIQTQLVAFIAPAVDIEMLRTKMQQLLPNAWVPSHFVTVSELPLLPTGKVDRKDLSKRATHLQAEFILDSLGLIREAGKEVNFTMKVVQCSYLVAIIHIMLDHWSRAFCHHLLCGVSASNVWMVVFYFGYGVSERIRSETPAMGKQEAILLFIYITWHYSVQSIFGTLAFLFGSPEYIHLGLARWYVLWMILAKTILVVSHAFVSFLGFRKPIQGRQILWMAAAEGCFCLIMAALSWYFGLGLTDDAHGFVRYRYPFSESGMPLFLNMCLKQILDLAHPDFISIPTFCMTLAVFVVAYEAGANICYSVSTLMPQHFLQRAFVRSAAITIFAASLVVVRNDELVVGRWHECFNIPFGLVVAFAFNIFQLGCLIVGLSGLPSPMAFFGRLSLFAFISHESFRPLWCKRGLTVAGVSLCPSFHDAFVAVQARGGTLGVTAVLYAYPVAFLIFIAWPVSAAVEIVSSSAQTLWTDLKDSVECRLQRKPSTHHHWLFMPDVPWGYDGLDRAIQRLQTPGDFDEGL